MNTMISLTTDFTRFIANRLYMWWQLWLVDDPHYLPEVKQMHAWDNIGWNSQIISNNYLQEAKREIHTDFCEEKTKRKKKIAAKMNFIAVYQYWSCWIY